MEPAILEKARREVGGGRQAEKMVSEIRQVLYKHGGWTFSKPGKAEDAAIQKSRRRVESGEENTVPVTKILKMLREKQSQKPLEVHSFKVLVHQGEAFLNRNPKT